MKCPEIITVGMEYHKVIIVSVITGVLLLGVLYLNDFLLGPDEIGELYKKAEKAYDKKEYEDAIAEYQKILEKLENQKDELKDEFDVFINYKIALCHMALGNYSKSERLVQKIYDGVTDPDHKKAINYLWGYVLYKQDKYPDAKKKFQEFTNDNNRFGDDALYALGNINYRLDKYQEAREYFESLVEKYPKSKYVVDAQLFIAYTHSKVGDFERAELVFREIGKTKNDEILYRKGHNQLCLGEIGGALSTFLDCDTAEEAQRRFKEALKPGDLDDELEASNFLVAVYFDLGSISLELEDYKKARDYFNKCLEYESLSKNAEMYKGMVPRANLGIVTSYFGEDNWGWIIDNEDKIIKREIQQKAPDLRGNVNRLLAYSFYKQKNYEQAAKLYEKISVPSLSGNYVKDLEEYCQAFKITFEEGQTEEIAKQYADKKALEELLKDEGKYMAGFCYYHSQGQDDLDQAITFFDSVINNNSPHALNAYYGKVLAKKDLAEKYAYPWTDVRDSAKEVLDQLSDGDIITSIKKILDYANRQMIRNSNQEGEEPSAETSHLRELKPLILSLRWDIGWEPTILGLEKWNLPSKEEK